MQPDTTSNTRALTLVGLPRLMGVSAGRRDLRVGLVDGPVHADHPDLASAYLEDLAPPGDPPPDPGDPASHHATAVAGILVAQRGSAAPAICPGVTLVVRPIFGSTAGRHALAATPGALASAIVEAADAGVRVLNLSLALARNGHDNGRALQHALDRAAGQGLIVIAAAGDHAAMGGSAITGHRAVIPVVAYNLDGQPAPASNLGLSIGRHGVGATGSGLVSLGAGGGLRPFDGSSAAAAVVTGAVALLWSEFPRATAASIRHAVVRSTSRRTSVIPPLLNAWRAYEILRSAHG